MKKFWSYLLPEEISEGANKETKNILRYQYGIDVDDIVCELGKKHFVEREKVCLEELIKDAFTLTRSAIGMPWYEELFPRSDNKDFSLFGIDDNLMKSVDQKEMLFFLLIYVIYRNVRADKQWREDERIGKRSNKERKYARFLNDISEMLDKNCSVDESGKDWLHTWYNKNRRASENDKSVSYRFIDYEEKKFISRHLHYNYLGYISSDLYAVCPFEIIERNKKNLKLITDEFAWQLEQTQLSKMSVNEIYYKAYGKRMQEYYRLWAGESSEMKYGSTLSNHLGKSALYEMILIYESNLPFFTAIDAVKTCHEIREEQYGKEDIICNKAELEILKEAMKLQNVFIVSDIMKVLWGRRLILSKRRFSPHTWGSGDMFEEYTPLNAEISSKWKEILQTAQHFYYPLQEAIFVEIMDAFKDWFSVSQIKKIIEGIGQKINLGIVDVAVSETGEIDIVTEDLLNLLAEVYYEESKSPENRVCRNNLNIFGEVSAETGERDRNFIKSEIRRMRVAKYMINPEEDEDFFI